MSNDDVVSVPTQTPQIALEMDSDTAHYVGILEGTIAALVINECKYRALLELLTGESWEGTRIDIKGDVLQGLAVSALVRQTGMDLGRAKLLVAQRWNTRNQPEATMVPVAVPVETSERPSDTSAVPSGTPGTADPTTQGSDITRVPDMGSRLSRWKAKQAADADQVAP